MKPFIDLAWKLNSDDPNWVAPLRMSLSSALDRKKHPFHKHADVAYFLAERPDGEAVGRIAAIVNRLHNEFHEDRVGFFGLFECEQDPTTAEALFDAAAAWLVARGMTEMRGPVNFSTNEEIASPGILIQGFETRPKFMMGHNPRYYPDLFDSAGFVKAKDLLAFLFDDPDAMPQRWLEMSDRMVNRHGAKLRTLDLRHFRRDVDAMKEVYNSAWARNWGFVPMTDEEFEHLAKEFRPVVDPELCILGFIDGEPIGFSLALPDLNEALRFLPSGRLLPFGFLKFLWYRRKIKGIRVMTLGLKPRYIHSGLGVAFYLKGWRNGANLGYTKGEASWVLEDNLEMVRALERMGAVPYRKYRLYERPLT